MGLNEAGGDLDTIAKFLDIDGSQLDYRHYDNTLFDILIAGSMLGEFHCNCLDWIRLSPVAITQINENISLDDCMYLGSQVGTMSSINFTF